MGRSCRPSVDDATHHAGSRTCANCRTSSRLGGRRAGGSNAGSSPGGTVDGMRFFLDTEFLDAPDSTSLISIGLVSSAGSEFYAISSEYPRERVEADPWLRENVLPALSAPGAPAPLPLASIAGGIEQFAHRCDDGKTGEIWAWNGAYDFYLFAKLWGRMLNIPQVVPHRFFDLKQWARDLGNVTVPAQEGGQHHALADARHDLATYEWLRAYARERGRRRDEKVRRTVIAAATSAAANVAL